MHAREQQVLGGDVKIEIEPLDETTSIIPIDRIIRHFRRNANCGLICLVGVQTNQFARAVDLARQFRSAGIKVAIGGFHVSGCVAMLPELTSEIKEALALGVTLFVGEAEGRLSRLFQDAYEDRLEPIYNVKGDPPSIEGQPVPFLPIRSNRYLHSMGAFDAGRGCPFSCSFCTIINVQGRKSRYRSADDVERIIRINYAQGVRQFFITDDNFARNRNWEAILDRLIRLAAKEEIRLHLTIQVDTLCHKIPNFVAKAVQAGCKTVFIGLESINPESLRGASKSQNQITEYRAMLHAWCKAKVFTYAGYILGFPGDTPESIVHDIGIVQRELPIDLLEFFILTPLPGSKDHQTLYLNGTKMDPDINRYDVEHVTTAHPRMTREQLQASYDGAWHLYYSPEHIETVLRRAHVSGKVSSRLAGMIFLYYATYAIHGVHPLQGGLFRRKVRKQRRAGMSVESPLAFYPCRLREIVASAASGLRLGWRILRIWRRVLADPAAPMYTDTSLAAAENGCGEKLEMFEATESAQRAVERARRMQLTRRNQQRAKGQTAAPSLARSEPLE
jgi:tRNA A37 methylthiotransferase MiaB